MRIGEHTCLSRETSYFWLAVLTALILSNPHLYANDIAVELPERMRVVWDGAKAYHEKTTTRERICLNGLWRWQPASAKSDQVPVDHWGYFKVPGCWPGITDYMQKDSQTLYAHPSWRSVKLGELNAAWYEREFSVPKDGPDEEFLSTSNT
jgi:hypothetical protein